MSVVLPKKTNEGYTRRLWSFFAERLCFSLLFNNQCQSCKTETMKRFHQSPLHKVLGWFLVLLLSQLCSAVLAAEKHVGHSVPVGTIASSEYDAFLNKARFMPSPEQQRAVESLFDQLKKRHITIKPTLYTLLTSADSDQLVALCQKVALFFSHVDNTRTKNSGCLSSMIRTKKQIGDFIGQDDASITTLAAFPYLPSITGMCSYRGVPDSKQMKNLLSWPVWQMQGRFCEQRFRSVCAMFRFKGLPKEQDVQAILAWPAWQLDGQFNIELFRSFSSMLSGKGVPEEQVVNAILAWPVWQVDGEFQQDLFRSLSSMFSCKGLPQAQDVKALLSWPVWQLNGQFNICLLYTSDAADE